MDPLNNLRAGNSYASSGFFVLRTPLLPIEEFLAIVRDAAGADDSVTAYALRQWAQRPEVTEALWIASPDFAHQIEAAAWRSEPQTAKNNKLERALYRYLARMTARATPFGGFAACSLGEIGDRSRIELSPRNHYQRRTRVRMEYLCSLAETIASDPLLRCRLLVRRNSTLHLAAGKYHHVRGYPPENPDEHRLYHLVATDPTPALDSTLQRASSGVTAGVLAAMLAADDSEITLQEAEQYVGRLVETQLLVCDLMPPVTGAEPICHMIEQLEQSGISSAAAELRALAGELRALDQGGLGAGLRVYDQLAEAVARLGGEGRRVPPVHMDVIKPAAIACLDQHLTQDILRAVDLLHSIQDWTRQAVFQRFIDDFVERYGDREVPLLEALDDEAGVGFDNEGAYGCEPLLAGIDFRASPESIPHEEAPIRSLLARRVEELRANKSLVLELDEQLLEELKARDPLPLPDAFAALGILFSCAPGESGFFLQSVSGPSGANLFARFCHADEHLAERVQEHLRAEETIAPRGAISAEITHLPEGEVGNVVCRPILRHFEIPYLGTSALPRDRQIPLSDIVVCVRGGRIVLRSSRLRREVLPRMTAAHNFLSSRNLRLYKFLCLLQNQGVASDLWWNWGALETAAFLPRVRMANIVFSLARWTISGETALQLRLGQAKSTEQRDRVRQWREANQVPRFAYITELDNQVLIDFESKLGMDVFLDHIARQPSTQLVEMFPAPDALAVHGPEGSFVHEMVVPFVRHERRIPPLEMPRKEIGPSKTLSAPALDFGAGEDWLFAKLYCSQSHADRLLLDLVKPMVEQLAGAFQGWFFVRYADPRWHLRLRLRGAPQSLSTRVYPLLVQMAEEQRRQGTLWRLEFDHYAREVDRYGGARAMDIAEQLFQVDSEFCLSLLPLLGNDDGAELRWQVALCSVDCLLSALGFNVEEKQNAARSMRAFCEQAYQVDHTYKAQLAHAFRKRRGTLAALLRGGGSPAVIPPSAASALSRLSTSIETIRGKLEDLRRSDGLTSTIAQLAGEFTHMHLNRMFRSSHHAQEVVLYDFLVRSYASQVARGRDPQER